MTIIEDSITLDQLKQMSTKFDNMVKAVVDVDRELLAVDAELHADLEAILLQEGSKQKDLWGINLYPEMQGNDFVEFDSMINVRPSQNNRSRGVEDETIRACIIKVVEKRVKR